MSQLRSRLLQRRSLRPLLAWVVSCAAVAGLALLAAHAETDEPGPATGAATLSPRDDSFVRESEPDANFNASSLTIAVDAIGQPTGSPDDRGYLRFEVAGAMGTLTSAELLVYNWAGAPTTLFVGAFSTVDDDWNGAASGLGDETTITHNVAPAADAMLDVRLAPAGPAWISFSGSSLTEYVRAQIDGDEVITVRLEVQSEGPLDICLFEDRENGGGTGNTPRLVLAGITMPTPTPTPTATSTPTPTATATATPTPTATRTPTPTASVTGTRSPTPTSSATPTVDPNATATPTPSRTPSRTASVTSTQASSVTATPVPSESSTQVPPPTAKSTATGNPTGSTATPTGIVTDSTPSGSPAPTFIVTPGSPTATPAATSSRTATHSPSTPATPATTPTPTAATPGSPTTSPTTPTAVPDRPLYLPHLSNS